LEAQIAARGIADRVRLLGSIPHGDLPDLLAAADVMALASASEGLANAWVEALACGTPIVITAAGGAGEVVTEPGFGRIVARAPQAFAAAIGALLDDPPAQADVRRGAERFTWDANSAALFDHLTGLVAHFPFL
jgi:glycosyltransferase involved in cell wall biosynthesis